MYTLGCGAPDDFDARLLNAFGERSTRVLEGAELRGSFVTRKL